MTAAEESSKSALVSSTFYFDDISRLPDKEELPNELFPNSPTKSEEKLTNDSVDDEKISDFTESLLVACNEKSERTVEKLRLSVPVSPIWSGNYSSSSESSSSIKGRKIRKRYCVKCCLQFRKTVDFHDHLRTHVCQPNVELERLSERNRYYKDFLKRQLEENSDDNGGLKIKLKVLSGAQNFEVIPNALDEQNRGRGIRILTAKEIKLSPTRSTSAGTTPLAAMVALAEMTFNDPPNSNYMTEQDRVHYECPTLDGLDQFNNEEVNKETAAQLLKQLLETPQMPQDIMNNEWQPSNEFISIDRLAHICTVCHSNFPDAVMLYEHKRITGHDFQNMFQSQNMANNAMQRPPFLRPRSQTQLSGYPQPPLHPINHQFQQNLHQQQLQQQHQQQQQQQHQHQQQQQHQQQHQQHQQQQHQQQQHQQQLQQQLQQQHQGHQLQQGHQVLQGQQGQQAHHPMSQHDSYAARYPRPPMQQINRRTPPPLYRPSSQGISQNQPLNMTPFLTMNPDMYNPPPNINRINGNVLINSNSFAQNPRVSPLQRASPQQRVSPLQRVSPHQPQQQQQVTSHPQHPQFNSQGMMRPPMNVMRQIRPVQPGQALMVRHPMYAIKRAVNGMLIRSPLPASPQPVQPTHSIQPSLLRPRLMGPPAKKVKIEDGDDCEVISMQPRSDGLPVIHSVQGGAANTCETSATVTQKSPEPYQLSEITLSVKGKEQTNKNPKEVATILAHRGITVTSSKPVEQREKSPSENGTVSNAITEEAVQKIQLNSSLSIIQKKKPTTIDLSNDDEVVPLPAQQNAMACPIKDCPEVFPNQESLNRHMQRGHKAPQLHINRCRLCPAKFSSTEGLSIHQKKVHRVFKTTASELGLPVVDLRNEQTRSKLAALGIINYIPLSHLNRSADGVFGLPIVSVQGAANSAICNLAAIGADSLISIGPVKAIPRNQILTTKSTDS